MLSPFPAANQLFAHRCHWTQTHWHVTAQRHSEKHIKTHTFTHTHLDVFVCANVCVFRSWYSHYCDFVTAGALWVDHELFQLPPDAWLRLWTQTSSRDKRAVWLSHCRHTVTGLQVNSIQHEQRLSYCKSTSSDSFVQHLYCMVSGFSVRKIHKYKRRWICSFLPVIITQQRARKPSWQTDWR